MSRKRKIALWTAGVVACPFVLIILLMVAIYLPPVQRWAVRAVSDYASRQTGWNISMGSLSLRFPLDLDLRDISVTNPDTLLITSRVTVGIDFSQVLHARLGVKGIDIEDGNVDTQDLVTSVRIRGSVGNFHLNADCIDLKRQSANLTAAQLSGADVSIELQDTTVVDTTESAPVEWTITLGQVAVKKTRIAFHMPGDTLSIGAYVSSLTVADGDLDLGQGIYQIESAELAADMLSYDNTYEPYLTGFDYNHIFLSDISLGVQNIYYSTDSLSLYLQNLAAKEKSGLEVSQMKSHFLMLTDGFELPDTRLATPNSTIAAAASLDWDALEAGRGGNMEVELTAEIGMGDVAIFIPQMAGMLPQSPLNAEVRAKGNVDQLELPTLHLSIAPMIDALATGNAANLLDIEHLAATIDWNVKTYDLSLVNQMAGLGSNVRFPQMSLTGRTTMESGNLTADLSMRQCNGKADMNASYDLNNEVYSANLSITDLRLDNFLPEDSLHSLTARAKVAGAGTDVFSTATHLSASLAVDTLVYGSWNLGGIELTGTLVGGEGQIDLTSHNALLQAQTSINTQLARDTIAADLALDLQRFDLHALGLVEKPFCASLQMNVSAGSNMKDSHSASGSLQTIELDTGDTLICPMNLHFSCGLLPDSLYATASAGDLDIVVSSRQGLDSLLYRTDRFMQEVTRQVSDYEIDQRQLKDLLPSASLSLTCGSGNPIHNVLYALLGYKFDTMSLWLESDCNEGLYADGKLLALNTGAIQIDTIRYHLYQDSLGVVNMNAHVENNAKNKQVVFSTDLMASVTSQGLSTMLLFRDAEGRKGVELGASLYAQDGGLRLSLQPAHPIVAYRDFTLNEDNYIFLGKDGQLKADVDLLSDDGTGLKIYTTENDDALADITLSVHDLNIGEITALLPYMPDIKGMLDCDVHYVREEEQMSVSLAADVAGLEYEDILIGDLGADITYLPNADGSHFVDGVLSYNDDDILYLTGTYFPDEEGGSFSAEASMQHLPLSLANAFIPNQMAGMGGYIQAELSVEGPVSAPVVNGILSTDSMSIYSDMYSLDLRFPDDTLSIRDNYISLNHIEAYSTGKTPLILDGNIDCRRFDRIGLDLSVEANNFELINAQKTRQAVAYGKVFVNLLARLTGTLNDLSMRGSLTVLGSTDVTYVLTDSPLTVDDQLADLVEFTDFSEIEEPDTLASDSPQNIDMQMALSIEQTAQVHCLLSTDGSNYIDLEGGGDFTMTYDILNGLNLFGRYTVISGEMNYSIMVLSLKDCTIKSGSYVEFSGDVMNPRLNLSASEKVKSTVTENNVPRSVSFDVGVSITQTLDNMGLEFTVEAPEDMTISNQLATLTAEGRSKVAVTLMVTGMYIAEDGSSSGGFSGSNALNSFLQSQISSISNKALSTIDLSFGVDNTSTASGGTQTDYNFSFAKRFWGNRISLIIGGKVSSGDDVENNGQSIIDNVSIEYRLDSSATRYVRVYYDKNTESVLEGEITEMGAGLVLRRKSNRLSELFIFKKKGK